MPFWSQKVIYLEKTFKYNSQIDIVFSQYINQPYALRFTPSGALYKTESFTAQWVFFTFEIDVLGLKPYLKCSIQNETWWGVSYVVCSYFTKNRKQIWGGVFDVFMQNCQKRHLGVKKPYIFRKQFILTPRLVWFLANTSTNHMH